MKSLLFVLAITFSFASIAQQGAIFTTPTTGTIDGIAFTITSAANSNTIAYDLSTASYSAAPLSTTQDCYDYEGFYDVTITLASPVMLYVYPKFWRTDTYTFSDPTALLSGTNLTYVDPLTTSAVSFADGIIQVLSPVTTFTIAPSFQVCCNNQALTFAGTSCPSTSNSLNATACDSYTVPSGNATYSTSGIYMDTIPNMAGCDSILTIDVTINTVDTTVTQIDDLTLSSNQAGATYEWIDCDNNNAPVIGNHTNQSFTTIYNGHFAVVATINGCSDTSACYLIYQVGLSSLHSEMMSIYPNPAHDKLTLKTSAKNIDELYITNITGKVIAVNLDYKNGIDVSGLENGVYFLNVIAGAEERVLKFMKE